MNIHERVSLFFMLLKGMELHLILLILIITVLVVFLTYRSRMNSYDMYGSGDQIRPPVR